MHCIIRTLILSVRFFLNSFQALEQVLGVYYVCLGEVGWGQLMVERRVCVDEHKCNGPCWYCINMVFPFPTNDPYILSYAFVSFRSLIFFFTDFGHSCSHK